MTTATTEKWNYRARARNGTIINGVMEGTDQSAVANTLMASGAVPLEITASNSGMQKEIRIGGPKKVKMKDLAVFSRQFATMLNAGLPMFRALNLLADQSENETLAKALRGIRSDIEGGYDLSAAMGRHPMVFPPIMVNMVKAGEAGGFLDKSMEDIADTFEKDVKLRGKIKSAMTYPVVILIMAILMCVGMIIFIVPVFEGMFENLGGELPLPTRVLVFLSGIMRWAAPAAVVGLVGFFMWWRKNSHKPFIRNFVDPLKLKLPVFGGLFSKIALARFTRNFATLLRSGVPILTALDIVSDTAGSVVISRALADVNASVRQGDPVAAPMAEHEVFPSMVVEMLSVGEETGEMDQMLDRIADFYEDEVEATTEALTALIEPLMIMFLGIVVGSMIIALYLPIFKVFDMIG